ncbi:MAG: DEAD/DEAH box helicase [Chitinophagales bacterium]|nr:DEAD/DEAH box helicase [Chitinophagales bacterium]
MELFRALGLSESTLAALEKKGFSKPSPIQERTIPTLLSTDKDVVGQAQTGTGKTAAFGLPLIERLDENSSQVQALILCPTRELAVQVAEEIMSFRGGKKLSVLPIYGGQSYEIQIRGLRKGAQIVVGTPGRVQDHINKGTLKLNTVKYMVLDEADEMLNMGFEEEVREILKDVPEDRRMLLFSATMPPNILRLVKTFIKPGYELVEVQKEQVTTVMVDQMLYEVRDSDRFEALCRIIDTNPDFYGIVFCKTRVETDQLSSRLNDRGYETEGIHGDVTQSQRELILKSFKAKKLRILVATDVAARGIDVNDLTHVVNYQLPQDPEAYVHRIGRTGRAGKKGIAVSLVSRGDMRDIAIIQRIAKTVIRKEVLPTVQDVIAVKKQAFKKKIQVLLELGATDEYAELADELLGESTTHAELVAALLKYAVKDELSETNYAEVADMSVNGGRGSHGSIRLFVAKGRNHGMNPQALVQFLETEGGVSGKAINDVRLFDEFSFITVPHNEGEQLLAAFAKPRGSGKPLITRAKEKDGSGGGGFGRSEGGFGRNEGGRGGNFERRERSDFPPRRNDGDSRERKPYGKSAEGGRGSFEKKSYGGDKGGDTGFKKRERKPMTNSTSFSDRPKEKTFDANSAPKTKPKKSNPTIFEPKFDNDLSW